MSHADADHDADHDPDDDLRALWSAGRLDWKLHSNQAGVHALYRQWEARSLQERIAGRKIEGRFPRIFVFDCSRRYGKDYFGLIVRDEDAIRRPGSVFIYATAFQKDIHEILIPMQDAICADCPEDIKPRYRDAYRGQSAGFYFPNGSVIKLVGIDKNPDGLRGRFADGINISEAGFVDYLKRAVVSVLYPQLQQRLHATMCLNSTPPEIPGHAYDDLFVPDAKLRDAYVLRTIDDNPLLGDAEREEFIAASGGRDSDEAKREYFCIRSRSETRVVVPEFDVTRHVKESPMPEYAHAYTVIDPGVQHLCAIGFAYYDFERAKLVLKRDWAKRNANTDTVAEEVKRGEAELWAGQNGKPLRFWDGKQFRANPFQRMSDTDLRLILDLRTQYGIAIAPVEDKDVEADLHALRNAFLHNKIEIDPACVTTIAHLEKAVWNKARTSYEVSDVFGHFDCVELLKYLWRRISRTLNPNPPQAIELTEVQGISRDSLHIPRSAIERQTKTVKSLNAAFSRQKRH